MANKKDNSSNDGFDMLENYDADEKAPSSRKKADKKKKKKRRLIIRNAILITIAVIMAFAGGGLIYYYKTIDSLNYSDTGDFDESENYDADGRREIKKYDIDINRGTVNMSFDEGQLLNDPMVLNVMLFGADKNDGSSQRSDTIIMMSIDNRHKKLKITSFMRDLWVYIPEYGYSKLNHSYAYGGPKLTIATIEQNFGINIDRYAVVDFDSFREIIDILGGIDMELSAEEIDYINWQCWKNHQVKTRNELQDAPGMVHLNGRQALWYARNRGDEEMGFAGSDFDRTDRQRKLIRKLASDMKSASLADIIAIVDKIGPLVTTNLKKNEITTLVANSLTYLSYNLVEYRLPSDSNYDAGWHYGMSTLDIVDMDKERKQLSIFVYEELVTDAMEGYMTYEMD
ncbi:MAG: LCP family protein [Clostridia bacterium]|nr:LCP family protein [Clostridia bacterium]